MSRIPVSVTYNFREVAGYQTPEGKLADGVLFRSDALHLLDDSGQEAVKNLGIATIVDLRDASELDDAPSRVEKTGATVLSRPILDPQAEPSYWGEITMEQLYESMVLSSGERFVAAISEIANAPSGVLVHCTAGKDRTGMTIALTLSLLGVSRDEVVENYALTEKNLKGEWLDDMLAQMNRFGVESSDEVLRMVGASPAWLLDHTLDLVVKEAGSVENYLLSNGLSPEVLKKLRVKLISN